MSLKDRKWTLQSASSTSVGHNENSHTQVNMIKVRLLQQDTDILDMGPLHQIVFRTAFYSGIRCLNALFRDVTYKPFFHCFAHFWLSYGHHWCNSRWREVSLLYAVHDTNSDMESVKKQINHTSPHLIMNFDVINNEHKTKSWPVYYAYKTTISYNIHV